jgi:TatD DNase family protein
MLIDTHVHLDHLADVPQSLAAARGCGVSAWVVPGVLPEQWPRLMATVAATAGAWAAPGVHPQHADQWHPHLLAQLRRLSGDARTVALGEVGLDGLAGPALPLQCEVFRQMVRLARETARPLLLHCRRATAPLLDVLRSERADEVGGIAHAFSGSLETARQLIDLGFAIGLGGVVTFPAARRLAGVVAALPAEWLVLESDAPDLPPHPHRGAANRPEWLTLIAEAVAARRGWTLAETARITSANACRILHLPIAEELAP